MDAVSRYRQRTLATVHELVCEGGEVAFVSQMAAESVALRNQIAWFTSMIGKKSTLKCIQDTLRQLQPSAVQVTQFVQGEQTRWGIAWTFRHNENKEHKAQPTPSVKAKTSFTVSFDSASALLERIKEAINNFVASNGLAISGRAGVAPYSLEGVVFSQDSGSSSQSSPSSSPPPLPSASASTPPRAAGYPNSFSSFASTSFNVLTAAAVPTGCIHSFSFSLTVLQSHPRQFVVEVCWQRAPRSVRSSGADAELLSKRAVAVFAAELKRCFAAA
jgi:hypothetical protein